MTDEHLSTGSPTCIGEVALVNGSTVTVTLRSDLPSTLMLIEGSSYRLGQIGSFYRIPLGYTYLYAVCTAAGATTMSSDDKMISSSLGQPIVHGHAYRWLTLTLFGESIGSEFHRGVGQYPTIGDEVHVVTEGDMEVIYQGTTGTQASVSVGTIASTSGIPASIDVARMVGRHCAVVGSTGTGKSNFVTVMLEALADDSFPNARIVVIDPHGEYGAALSDRAKLFRVQSTISDDSDSLVVPFWALPLSELLNFVIDGMQPMTEAIIRDHILKMKKSASTYLANTVDNLTADSPIPFHIGKLWLDLDQFERMTFKTLGGKADGDLYEPIQQGNANRMIPYRYPEASPYNKPPYRNPHKRNIERKLDLMASRLRDPRFAFLFSPGDDFSPTLEGQTKADMDQLVAGWLGHNKPVTVFDVSGIPSEVLQTIVGTMLRIMYDMLFWGQHLPMGGRQQPLLIVMDEAHRFVPKGGTSSAHRTLSMIAKEGRKYGIGLVLVSQRPSEMDSDIISQFGSLVALRLTNRTDRAHVATTVPDDLGALIELLPSLRTGEAVLIGEMVSIPSRVRIRMAGRKIVGSDPKLPDSWQTKPRPDSRHYRTALANWRAQSLFTTRGEDSD